MRLNVRVDQHSPRTATAVERVVLLHGFQNRRPREHWQHWLAEELRRAGAEVRYPQLPEPDAPKLDAWLEVLERELEGAAAASTVVVAHSLGAALWLDYTRRRFAAGPAQGPVVARTVLVAPPSRSVALGIPEIAAFAPPAPGQREARALHAASIEAPQLVASDADPYDPEGVAASYAEPYGLDARIVPGGGHLTPADGFGPFPLLLELATRPVAAAA